MTSEKIIVLVSDRDDSNHGEISVLDDPEKAERLVETLLEAGFAAERIRVFTGRTSDFQVSQRPVVALMGEGEESEAEAQPAEAPAMEAPPVETPPVEVGAREETVERREEPVPAAPAAPIRFSSLFRSA